MSHSLAEIEQLQHRLLHYELLEPVGTGGMGTVYKARDTRLGRLVAVKILARSPMVDHRRQRRFDREARIVSALDHPGIVTVYDIVTRDDERSIVMEWIDGVPLSALIPAGGLATERVVRYAIDITEAMQAAHEAGVVHRDLKPQNIMLPRVGERLKVLDFGVAKLGPWGEPEGPPETGFEAPLTRPGVPVGTLAYMSPEQAGSEPRPGGVDSLSVGARRPTE